MKFLWLSALACNGNTHALLNHPAAEDLLERWEWLYHPLLPSRYGLEAVEALEVEAPEILIVDGTLEEGWSRYRRPFEELLEHYGQRARRIVTVGTCASFGGIFAETSEKRGGVHFRKERRLERFASLWIKTVTLPGCPVQPEVLAGTLELIASGEALPLDALHRPLYYYAYTVHNGCTRNEYFEYKIDEHRFGRLEGCTFYEHGCQGTYTHAPCNKILHNGVNSKTRNGQPCMGCTEPDFPRRELWHTRKNMGIPARMPLGVPRRAYLSLAGVAKAFRIERFERPLMEGEEPCS